MWRRRDRANWCNKILAFFFYRQGVGGGRAPLIQRSNTKKRIKSLAAGVENTNPYLTATWRVDRARRFNPRWLEHSQPWNEPNQQEGNKKLLQSKHRPISGIYIHQNELAVLPGSYYIVLLWASCCLLQGYLFKTHARTLWQPPRFFCLSLSLVSSCVSVSHSSVKTTTTLHNKLNKHTSLLCVKQSLSGVAEGCVYRALFQWRGAVKTEK